MVYTVEDSRTSECPVSAITQRSLELVQLVAGMKKAGEASGATLPLDRLPGAAYDAARVIRNEEIAAENARIESETQAWISSTN